jgi:mono/diheme cytochrome c family protein
VKPARGFVRGLALAATLAGAALVAGGCGTGGLVSEKTDAAHGKELFVQKCGSCHTLSDAGTQGKVGPNLDDAFAGPRAQGFKESTIRNIVHGQILFPVSSPAGVIEVDGKEQRPPGMPAKLVSGSDAEDVAAYVASVAGLSAAGGATTQTTTTTAATTTSAGPPATTTAATTTTGGGGGGDLVAQGKTVFEKAGCTSCHTLADAGANGTVGPNLDARKPPKALVVDRVTNGKGVMPPFKGQLSAAEIQAVAAYVSSVAGK